MSANAAGSCLAAVNYKMVQSGVCKGAKSYKKQPHLSVNLPIHFPHSFSTHTPLPGVSHELL